MPNSFHATEYYIRCSVTMHTTLLHCMFDFQGLFWILLGVILLSCLLPAVYPQGDGNSESKASVEDNDVARIAENMFDNVLNNSRS